MKERCEFDENTGARVSIVIFFSKMCVRASPLCPMTETQSYKLGQLRTFVLFLMALQASGSTTLYFIFVLCLCPRTSAQAGMWP